VAADLTARGTMSMCCVVRGPPTSTVQAVCQYGARCGDRTGGCGAVAIVVAGATAHNQLLPYNKRHIKFELGNQLSRAHAFACSTCQVAMPAAGPAPGGMPHVTPPRGGGQVVRKHAPHPTPRGVRAPVIMTVARYCVERHRTQLIMFPRLGVPWYSCSPSNNAAL